MDVTPLLDGLNPAQRQAVTLPPGGRAALVLAGAGSGKTRVLTHRVAWVVGVEGVSPHSILAVTFTNKAAAEMRARIERLLGMPVSGMWIGTFHGLSHRFLRAHWREAGLPQNFQILDAEDQLRLVRRVLKGLNLDEAYWPPRQVQWFINSQKEQGRRPADLPQSDDPAGRQFHRLYQAYEEACARAGLVDFAELLLRVCELMRGDERLRGHYQRRFRHILVDEFQDTNGIQYEWLELFAGGGARLFVVGDDDQSIYGWRGARLENILRFEREHPGTTVVRLEQNYRSTGTILKAANSVIRHNRARLGKTLWTAAGDGEPVYLYAAFNEYDEARFVVERIQELVSAGGHARREIAILYRSNAQSRVFEETLIAAAVPYRVYGGLRFFERQEIKDALAYLRLIATRHDDASFERVANMPPRGIGDKTLEAVRAHARAQGLTLWQAASRLVAGEEEVLAARAREALAAFLALIERLAAESAGLALAETIEHVLAHSGLRAHYGKEKGEEGQARLENLEELVNAARGFEQEEAWVSTPTAEAAEGLDPLSAFLAHAALEAGEGEARPGEDCVQLMTLHAAKGLEFPVVFLTGMEEGLFPHQRALEEGDRLEEERRLCYVGMTRAMRRLYLSYAERRRLHGTEHDTQPSRFLLEIDPSCLMPLRASASLWRREAADTGGGEDIGAAAARVCVGMRVRHATFGEGVVTDWEGEGEHTRVQVHFEGAGTKWLVLAYARLEQLEAPPA
jgi:DNA helicase-2/ATP-dependent DNA helicase PcrA